MQRLGKWYESYFFAILPLPIRNICHDGGVWYYANSPRDQKETKAAIKRIWENSARLLFTSLLFACKSRLYVHTKSSFLGMSIPLIIFGISPSSSILFGATFFFNFSISKLVGQIATKSLADVAVAFLSITCSYFLSNNYMHYRRHLFGRLEVDIMSGLDKLMNCRDKLPERLLISGLDKLGELRKQFFGS